MDEARRDLSILLIEDNCDDEWFARWVLKKIGLANVTVARDGYEALLLLHGDDRQGSRATCFPEIVLLDLRLPKIDGLEVLARIRSDARTKNLAVIILTSSEDPHDQEICEGLGVTAFFPKPLKEEYIVNLHLFP